jgi:hypothetical protein
MVESWDRVQTFFSFGTRNYEFMNEKGEVVAVYSGKKWPWGLELLYINHHSSIKLQGQQKLIYDMFGAVRIEEEII